MRGHTAIAAFAALFTTLVASAALAQTPLNWAPLPAPPEPLATVAVKSGALAVATSSSQNVYLWNGASWTKVPGSLQQVDVDGSRGAPQIIGVDGSGRIQQWQKAGFVPMAGALQQVALGGGEAWGVAGGSTLQVQGGAWTRVSGSLKNISVGGDGTVWGVNSSGEPQRRTGRDWERMPRLGATNTWANPAQNVAARQVAVGSATQVWAVDTNGRPWHYNGFTWDQLPAPAPVQWLSALPDGSVWGVMAGGKLMAASGPLRYWTAPAASAQLSDKVALAWSTVQWSEGDRCAPYSRATYLQQSYWNGELQPGAVPTVFAVEKVGEAFRLLAPNGKYVRKGNTTLLAAAPDGATASLFAFAGNRLYLLDGGNRLECAPRSSGCDDHNLVSVACFKGAGETGWLPLPGWAQ